MTARAHLRRSSFLLAVALCAPPAFSQKPETAGVHEVAHLVDTHYNQLHSLKTGFTETYRGMGIERTETGTLLLLKPGRMRWDYTSPAGKVFLLDGKYGWFYTPGSSQVQRISAKQLDDLRSPLRFLLGHTQLEKELAGLALTPGPSGSFILSGQPRGQENRVSQVKLTVSAAGTISALEIQETDGAVTRFSFTAEQPNAPIPDSTFRFTPPAGVPVVDSLPPV